MTIQRIEYGSLADSELINSNFTELQTEISSVGSSISTLQSNISSVNSTLNSNINTLETNLTASIDSIEDDIDALESAVSNKSYAPNYSSGISVSIPYTAPSDGWMYLTVDGYDWEHPAYVNNKQVGVSCGYSGGKAVRNGVMFMVSKNDVVSGYISTAIFYPMKGAN